MTDQSVPPKYWNIFARALEDILSAHHLQMDTLADQTGISVEKVRALTRSLHTPDDLPVLNSDEMKALEQKLRLSGQEKLYLRASLLAAFVQGTFVDRIDADDALLLAEQAFLTLLSALQTRAQGSASQEGTRWGAGNPVADDEFSAFFASIERTLHTAERELQLSYGVSVHATRVAKARTARASFQDVIAELESAERHIQALQIWRENYAASRHGLESAESRLKDLV